MGERLWWGRVGWLRPFLDSVEEKARESGGRDILVCDSGGTGGRRVPHRAFGAVRDDIVGRVK
jgi:hypothetical protein